MEPPRVPLHPLKGANNGAAKTVKMFGTSDISKPLTSVPASKGFKKFVAVEDMPAFKNAVQGSGLSKLGLIEVLNKQFAKTPKLSIKNTLEAYAKRVGVKEMDKKWEWVGNGAS
jgi:chromatin assembly factor 1 subunit A